jgi:hypothetical protein
LAGGNGGTKEELSQSIAATAGVEVGHLWMGRWKEAEHVFFNFSPYDGGAHKYDLASSSFPFPYKGAIAPTIVGSSVKRNCGGIFPRELNLAIVDGGGCQCDAAHTNCAT